MIRYVRPSMAVASFFLLVVVALASCSSDPEEEPPPETSVTSTTGTTVTPASVASVATTTEPTTTPTTEAFPTREVMGYLDSMQALSVRIGELVLDMRKANNDWDNKSVTGVSYAATEAAMEDVEDRALALRDDVGVIEPPSDRGLPVEHQTAWVSVGQMADAAIDALSGLRSTDTGEQRRAAVEEFLVAYERFDGTFYRIVEIIGVGAGIPPPTTTTATTAASTTTTSTTAAPSTTTSTTAAPTTSTTEADTTATTEATTTSAAVPPVPDVAYNVIDESNISSGEAVSILLTVQVDAGATKSQLAQIGSRLETEYRLSRIYQALLIEFSHYPEGADHATLGRWVHAPFGELGRAEDVVAGDYTQHQIDDRTLEKDWSLLPTREQVDLYSRYLEYRSNREDAEDSVPADDELIPMAAEEFGVTSGQIRDALRIWEAWLP